MKLFLQTFLLLTLSNSVWSNSLPDNKVINKWGYKLSTNINYNTTLCSGSIKPAETQLQAIKSIKPIADSHDTYYRFTIGIEIFPAETDMKKRFDELTHAKHQNSLQSKNCSLIRFFQCGTNVYFIHTDALLFESEMRRINNLYRSAVCKSAV